MSEHILWAHKTTPGSDHKFCTIYEDRPSGRAVARHVTPERAEFITRAANCHDELLEACEKAVELYDHLALGTLEAAAKYGPDYEPPSEADCLAVRGALASIIAKAEAPA